MKKTFLPLASLISVFMIAAPASAQVVTITDPITTTAPTISYEAQMKIQKVQDLVRAAGSHGLIYSLYFNVASEASLQASASINDMLSLDLKLTAIVNRLANDLSRGRILPSAIKGKTELKDKTFVHKLVADNYLNGVMSSYEFINTVAPKNRIYREAQEVVQRIADLKAQGVWTVKPASLTLATVKKGVKNAALIAYARKKLNNFGYPNNESSTVYDADLDMAVRAFQTDNGVGSDGVIGTQVTWKLLEKNVDQLMTQAILNLDRTRWLPDQNAAEYIYINLARQTFQYLENEVETLGFNTVNGRLDRQTPIMVDVAKTVILNPTWGVTYNIFVKDKIPLLREAQAKGENYAASHHMKLYSEITGLEVDASTVDWNLNASQLPYRLVQDPGEWNALGFIKFPLINGFAIYMHDTNERYLLSGNDRLRSSGCIRLQQPFELAEKLLQSPEYTVETLKDRTERAFQAVKDAGFPAGQEMAPTNIKLKRSVPVYVFYQTLSNKFGKIVASNDPYEIDKAMYAIMTSGK